MDYIDFKCAFFKAHGGLENVETTPMARDGSYMKYYFTMDGAVLYERNCPVYETAKAKTVVRGVEVVLEQQVKLFQTEAWNTDNAKSVFFYEAF